MPFNHPVIYFYNVFMVMATMSVALLTRRRVFTYSLIGFIWFGLAVTNFIIQSLRKTPFTAMDFYLIKDAIKVMGLYLKFYHYILIMAGILVVIFALVMLFIKAPKQKITISRYKFYGYGVAQIVFTFLVAYGIFATLVFTNQVEAHYGNLQQAYKKYGFCHCFVSSVINRGISKSSEYSEEYMETMKDDLDTVPDESDSTPNIIFLQLESFFDPTLLKGVTFSENPLPNFEELYKNYTSGYLSVPCFGAGTCNTEFEVQTGINLDDFGPGEYPYRTVMKSAICESVAYDLKNLGYTTHVVHNNDATFYDRYNVFRHLGYDTFTSIEYMNGYDETPTGWAKDEILTSEIEKTLDSTSGCDYIYTISVQGHGDYPTVYPEGYTPTIKVSGFSDATQATQLEYYVNQIHEMDEFIGQLTQMLSNREEKTVLVMYGDHLPTFNIEDESLVNGDKYQTQYVMWSNFDMDKETVNLQSYQLSAYVLERLGISEGYIMKYHQSRHNDSEEEYLKNLKILEYDILYGKQDIYNGKIPFEATDMVMGVNPIEIFDAYNTVDYVCVAGVNFTKYSAININGKDYETEYVSDRLIRIKLSTRLKAGDQVSVIQKGSDKVELSRVTYTVK